ncbi:hypothetical protein JTB14_002094 [Gonioctena quinquepunctata]|nr:hypothetical protein JTB14_002094 [Gonioctena quinquepunctata]
MTVDGMPNHLFVFVPDVPEDGSVLKTEVQKMAPGAELRANCTTPGSSPAMNVTWYINDVEMHSSFDVHIQKSIVHFDALPGLETVQSTITAKTTPDLFKGGKMKLRCLATMFTLYTSSREAEIQEDAPKLALIMVQNAHPNKASSQMLNTPQFTLSKMGSLLLVYKHIWLRI